MILDIINPFGTLLSVTFQFISSIDELWAFLAWKKINVTKCINGVGVVMGFF